MELHVGERVGCCNRAARAMASSARATALFGQPSIQRKNADVVKHAAPVLLPSRYGRDWDGPATNGPSELPASRTSAGEPTPWLYRLSTVAPRDPPDADALLRARTRRSQ